MRRNGKKNVRNRAEFVYNRNGDNMNTLQEAREKINAIDAQMADLFEERMRTVEDVIQYKKEHQMQVLDPTREQAVIERNQKRIRGSALCCKLSPVHRRSHGDQPPVSETGAE